MKGCSQIDGLPLLGTDGHRPRVQGPGSDPTVGAAPGTLHPA
jgi:hypothetical protein